MASSNSTININNCSLPDWFWSASSNATFAFYHIILPCCALFGLTGHILFIMAIRMEAKKEKAYRYQMFSLISETSEISMFVLNTVSKLLGGMLSNTGWLWYRSVYLLMFYSCHVSIPLLDSALTISLLLALCASADRVFVLTKPAKYQKLNHKLHQRLVLIVCVVAGLLINTDNCFLNKLVYNESAKIYTTVSNEAYKENQAIVLWGLVGHSIRISAVMTLISCNFIVIYQYHKRFGKVIKLNSKDARKRKSEKTLILLTICESCFFTISTLAFVGVFMAGALVPRFNKCEGAIFYTIMNSTLMTSSTADFYTALLISKHFRVMVKKALKRFSTKNYITNQFGVTQAPGVSNQVYPM